MNLRVLALCAAVVAAFAYTAPAHADTIVDTSSAWTDKVTSGWQMTGQTFETPNATDVTLASWTFWMAGNSTSGKEVRFSIYEWGGSSTTGSELYGTDLSWASTTSSYAVTGINLSLDDSKDYVAVIDTNYTGFAPSSVHYVVGDQYASGSYVGRSNGTWGTLSLSVDHRFTASFTGAAVPEPGTFALLGLSLFGVALHRRRGMAKAS